MKLVCFAVKEEAMAFQKLAAHRPGVAILVTGMGQKNAAAAVRDFLTVCPAELVLTCGFAGGLDPALTPGAVVFATDDEELGENLPAAGAKRAKLHCADRVAVTAADKRRLRDATGADAVEMESEAIRAVCRERALPCATVRVISDGAGEDLPLDFNQLYRPDMTLDYGKLAWAVFKAPGKIGALMKLQQRCRFAAAELAGVLLKVVAEKMN
jgi:adenosylhomocysteine nucleosidase